MVREGRVSISPLPACSQQSQISTAPTEARSTATSLLPPKPLSPLPVKPDPPLPACSQQSQIFREVRVRIPISNNPRFRLKHPGIPDASEGSDRASYPVTENYMLSVTQATGHIAYLPPLLCTSYTHHQNNMCVTLFVGAAVTSAKNISVRAEWLCQSGRALSEPSETPRPQYHTARCISPFNRCFTVSSRSVGLLF